MTFFRLGNKKSINSSKHEIPGAPELPRTGIYKYKKLSFGSAAVLAFLVVPLVAQGLSGSSPSDDPTPDTSAGQQTEGNVMSTNTGEASNESEATVDVSTDSSGGQTSGSSTTEVTVNGESIPVPQNGSVHKKVKGSNTTVDVSIESHNSGYFSSNNSSTTVEVEHNSSGDDEQADSRGGDRYSNHR